MTGRSRAGPGMRDHRYHSQCKGPAQYGNTGSLFEMVKAFKTTRAERALKALCDGAGRTLMETAPPGVRVLAACD